MQEEIKHAEAETSLDYNFISLIPGNYLAMTHSRLTTISFSAISMKKSEVLHSLVLLQD